MELINTNLNEQLDKLVTRFFEANRIADRIMSVLAVKFVMSKTSEILHNKLAHLYPLLADEISDYQGSRNCLTTYGATPEGGKIYSDPKECFYDLLDHAIITESDIIEVTHIAERNNDLSTKVFLNGFLSRFTKVTNQCLLLVDKAERYSGDWMRFDHDVDEFVIL